MNPQQLIHNPTKQGLTEGTVRYRRRLDEAAAALVNRSAASQSGEEPAHPSVRMFDLLQAPFEWPQWPPLTAADDDDSWLTVRVAVRSSPPPSVSRVCTYLHTTVLAVPAACRAAPTLLADCRSMAAAQPAKMAARQLRKQRQQQQQQQPPTMSCGPWGSL